MRRALAVLLLVAGACSAGTTTLPPDAGAPSTTDSGTYPLTVSLDTGDVELSRRPERIVSLSPTATEMLFAIGAGDQVVAVDDFSTYPPEAPVTDLSGYTPNLEAIAAYRPDLVVVSDDIDDVVSGLRGVGTPVAHLPAAQEIDGVYHQIETLGLLTDHLTSAARLTAGMRQSIDDILAGAPEADRVLTYYHELDPGLYAVASTTFLGRLYGLVGLDSIADAADADGTGYPQLSAEYVIEEDPDLIFLADAQCCGVSLETLAQRPGWSNLHAVESGHVFPMDADVASRWGPRIVDYIEDITAAVRTVVDE